MSTQVFDDFVAVDEPPEFNTTCYRPMATHLILQTTTHAHAIPSILHTESKMRTERSSTGVSISMDIENTTMSTVGSDGGIWYGTYLSSWETATHYDGVSAIKENTQPSKEHTTGSTVLERNIRGFNVFRYKTEVYFDSLFWVS